MENEEIISQEDLSQDQKMEIVKSWFTEYDIVKIVIKRPDYVIFLEE